LSDNWRVLFDVARESPQRLHLFLAHWLMPSSGGREIRDP
jgi:hypothetical protein